MCVRVELKQIQIVIWKFVLQFTLNFSYYIVNTYLLRSVLVLSIIFTLNYCSADTSKALIAEAKFQEVLSSTYSVKELETMKLINDYMVSVGLKALKGINHISF
ncbi:MAG: hypothetical protein ACI9L6_001326 [Flavobacterium sp.]